MSILTITYLILGLISNLFIFSDDIKENYNNFLHPWYLGEESVPLFNILYIVNFLVIVFVSTGLSLFAVITIPLALLKMNKKSLLPKEED